MIVSMWSYVIILVCAAFGSKNSTYGWKGQIRTHIQFMLMYVLEL